MPVTLLRPEASPPHHNNYPVNPNPGVLNALPQSRNVYINDPLPHRLSKAFRPNFSLEDAILQLSLARRPHFESSASSSKRGLPAHRTPSRPFPVKPNALVRRHGSALFF